jgi:aminoglycoside 3-N-acetyltransferase
MSIPDYISKISSPRTRQSLAADLRALGLEAGMVVMVHTSLSKIGFINGGEVALIYALMDVLTAEGTLVMPAHTSDLSDPGHWENPPVPADWHHTIRDTMPAYDPAVTPTCGIGQTPNTFRTMPGVTRSDHPQVSVAAWGKHADYIAHPHPIENEMGKGSPFERMYALNTHILMLGTTFEECTFLHYAEWLAANPIIGQEGAPVIENGQRVWKTFDHVEYDEDLFPALGNAAEAAGFVRTGLVGSAETRLIPAAKLVDLAIPLIEAKRSATNPTEP